MTTNEMSLITGCKTWQEFAESVLTGEHGRYEEIELSISHVRIESRTDDNGNTVIFPPRKFKIGVDYIKARAWEEFQLLAAISRPFSNVPMPAAPPAFEDHSDDPF